MRSPPSVKGDERLWGWVCFQADRIITMVLGFLVAHPLTKKAKNFDKRCLYIARTMVFLSPCKLRRNITALILRYLMMRDSSWSDHCVFFVRFTLSKYTDMSPSQPWKSTLETHLQFNFSELATSAFDFQPRKIDRSIPRTTYCLAQTYINMTTEILHYNIATS